MCPEFLDAKEFLKQMYPALPKTSGFGFEGGGFAGFWVSIRGRKPVHKNIGNKETHLKAQNKARSMGWILCSFGSARISSNFRHAKLKLLITARQ